MFSSGRVTFYLFHSDVHVESTHVTRSNLCDLVKKLCDIWSTFDSWKTTMHCCKDLPQKLCGR